jgi:hypothetical protein
MFCITPCGPCWRGLSPRNPIAAAPAQRSLSNAAGKHIRSRKTQRRADKVALQKALFASARFAEND